MFYVSFDHSNYPHLYHHYRHQHHIFYITYGLLIMILVNCCNLVQSAQSDDSLINELTATNTTVTELLLNSTFKSDKLSTLNNETIQPSNQQFSNQTTISSDHHKSKVKKYNSSNFNDSHDNEVHLISWRWAELGNYFLIGAFLLIAAGVKICYHHSHTLSTHVPESCVLIILGTIVGTILFYADIQESEYVPKFKSEVFFYILLPPIILESAYSLYDKSFFNNLGTILLYAVVGTIINISLIGPSLYFCSEWGIFGSIRIPLIECVIFSTLISAVDPVAVLAIFAEVNVNKALYFLVFGESLLNDAVVVTMYNTVSVLAGRENIRITEVVRGIASFLITSGGGVFTGLFLGALSSIVTRFTTDVRVVEPLIVICLAYISYVGAELFHFSGIISLICCGLMQAEYTRHNISKKSYTTIKYLTKTVSSIADVIIFLFLGMVLVRDDHEWNTGFVLLTTFFCIVYRFLSVFTLTYFANNFFQRLRIVNFAEQILMAYGGLRGAIAFSLAIMLEPSKISAANLFITATLFVILFTVFVLGSTTKPVVRFLQVKIHIKHEAKLFIEINNKVVETVMAGIEEVAGHRSVNYWVHKLTRFNDKYVKAILIRGGAEKAASIKTTYEKHYQDKEEGQRLLSQDVRVGVKSSTDPISDAARAVLNRAQSVDTKVPIDTDGLASPWKSAKASWVSRRTRTLPARPVGEPFRAIRKPVKLEKNEDVSRALAEAFSKSAYYQYTGGINSIEDREAKLAKENARKSKWLTAKSKIQLAAIASKSTSQGADPLPLVSVVKAAKALAAMKESQRAESVDMEKLNQEI